ncbi:MAG: hypothetical protein WAU73_00070 [Candidatus Sulfotelmatobacter sp.]
MKKLIVFDLDGTLAESKSPVDAEMSGLVHDPAAACSTVYQPPTFATGCPYT